MADQSRFAAMPNKQKVTVLIFLLIGAVIVWQVVSMFKGGGEAAPIETPPPTTAMSSATPAATGTTTPAPASTPAAVAQKSPPPLSPAADKLAAHATTPEQSHPTPAPAPPVSPLVLQQEQAQGRYVTALNELQMLKIQKEIAETSQAIVLAKLATVTTEKSITDILSPEPLPVVKHETTMTTTKEVSLPAAPPPQISSPPPTPQPAAPTVKYTVISVSMALDQWHAVLSYRGKLYNVSVGDTLAVDGSNVIAIDQNGVTLDTNGTKQKLPLTSTDVLPASSGDAPSGGSRSSAPGGFMSPPFSQQSGPAEQPDQSGAGQSPLMH